MKKYIVGIKEVHVLSIEVDAESFDDAIEKAVLVSDDLSGCELDYSYILPEDTWTVEEL